MYHRDGKQNKTLYAESSNNFKFLYVQVMCQQNSLYYCLANINLGLTYPIYIDELQYMIQQDVQSIIVKQNYQTSVTTPRS